MNLTGYQRVLANPTARGILLLGLLVRVPIWAANLVLTLHVVNHLGGSYSQAGIVTTVATVGLAISSPWRGRLVDRLGLRRTLVPSLAILPIAWTIAPFVGYWVLLPVVFVGSLFAIPTFSVVRQVLISAVDDADRKTALALESVFVEISFMIGPVLGVLAATYWSTTWSLLAFQWLSVAGGVALWLLNPPLLRDEDAGLPHPPLREWLGPVPLAILGATLTATLVLTGGDLGAVGALRAMDAQSSLGWVLAAWGLGSAIGGLAYGAMHRSWSSFVLVGMLGVVTIPVALAGERFSFAALLFVAGLFCAPTITATLDHLSRVVPARVRGEAMGWHGSALTSGSALGAPLVGVAMDSAGWQAGFVVAGVCGVLVGVAGQALVLVRRAQRAQRAHGTLRRDPQSESGSPRA